MAKIADLMLGNIVVDSVYETVIVVNRSTFFNDDGRDYLGIFITENLLKKLGFTLHNLFENEDEGKWEYYKSDDGRVEIRNLSNTVGRDWSVHIDNDYFETIGSCDIQYLHQLQNILTLCDYNFDLTKLFSIDLKDVETE